jgi:hypothetical protein
LCLRPLILQCGNSCLCSFIGFLRLRDRGNAQRNQ